MQLGGLELTYEGACALIQETILPAVIGRLEETPLWNGKPQPIDIFACSFAEIDDLILLSVHIAHPTNDKKDIRFVKTYPYHFEFATQEGVTQWATEIGQTLYDGIKLAAKQRLPKPKQNKKGTIH